jgi:hypothetical protein
LNIARSHGFGFNFEFTEEDNIICKEIGDLKLESNSHGDPRFWRAGAMQLFENLAIRVHQVSSMRE